MKFEIFNFDTVTSTNDVAIDMIIKKKNETKSATAPVRLCGEKGEWQQTRARTRT